MDGNRAPPFRGSHVTNKAPEPDHVYISYPITRVSGVPKKGAISYPISRVGGVPKKGACRS